MIKRLREAHSEERLKEIYAAPHDHRIYGRGHDIRVETTKVITNHMSRLFAAKSVADLSCGNGEIARSLGLSTTIFGDYAPGYGYCGPIEETIKHVAGVGLFILSETLEHLDDPHYVLSNIREKSKILILTTPLECWEDTNAEHYWAWDREGVESLLSTAGWTPNVFADLDTRVFGEPYLYGIWGCV